MSEPEWILSRWFRGCGWCVMPGAWGLVLRLGWEATVLTAREGPQMVGFSLVHGGVPWAIPLILSFAGAFWWTCGALIWLAVASVLRRRWPQRRDWIQVAIVAAPVLALFCIAAIT